MKLPNCTEAYDAFSIAVRHAREQRLFYIESHLLSKLFREECVIFMDLMGASYSYRTSLETPINILARTHSAVLHTAKAYPQINVYRFSDSYFFTLPDSTLAFSFTTNLQHALLTANAVIPGWCFGHFLLPRITMATGLVLEHLRIKGQEGDSAVLDNALIGPGIVKAFELERKCPPLGIVFAQNDQLLQRVLSETRIHAGSNHGHILRRFCRDDNFRSSFQRYPSIIVFPWFLFSTDQTNYKLQPATAQELVSKYKLLSLILHRFWHEYRMRSHRMAAEDVSGLPKGKRKAGTRDYDISDMVCANMGMYERMILDGYSMISGHPYTMPSSDKISLLRTYLFETPKSRN